MDPRSQILSRCSPTGISIYRKEKTGTARAFLPLVTDGRGGSEEHMPIQGKLHLCPGNRNLSRVILTDLIFQAGGLGREHNTQQSAVVGNVDKVQLLALLNFFLLCCSIQQMSLALDQLGYARKDQEWNCCPLLSSAPTGTTWRWERSYHLRTSTHR